MTREEAKSFIIDISYDLGNIDVEYLTEKDGKKMREAVEVLEQEPCEDAVSRNAIIKTLNEMDRYIATGLTSCKSGNKYHQNEVFIVDDVYEQIAEHLPSVTTRPKTGHWIKPTFDMIRNHICGSCEVMCSSCNEVEIEEYDYCPNCGAKMVEPQESEG